MKDAIVGFAQQTGVVFTLLASISAGGLFLEALVPPPGAATAGAAADVSSSIDIHQASSLFTISNLTYSVCGGISLKPILLNMAAPCFCSSTFFNLYGLINATNVLGRCQVIPTSQIKGYVMNNSWVIHSTYWTLLPAIGTFGLGVVCTVDHLYGEPLTTFAFVCSATIGISQTRNLIALGKYTESITTTKQEQQQQQWQEEEEEEEEERQQ